MSLYALPFLPAPRLLAEGSRLSVEGAPGAVIVDPRLPSLSNPVRMRPAGILFLPVVSEDPLKNLRFFGRDSRV